MFRTIVDDLALITVTASAIFNKDDITRPVLLIIVSDLC